jgi:Resolvase, N terminal domain
MFPHFSTLGSSLDHLGRNAYHPTMTAAFAYLRVSGKGQIQGDGFPRQLSAINAYARAKGISIVQVFREEGIGGAMESWTRPAWSELMTALHADGVKAIIIEKLDRLARDLMVQEATIADLQKYGFTLISVAEPDLMATDPTRILMRQLIRYVRDISLAVRVAMRSLKPRISIYAINVRSYCTFRRALGLDSPTLLLIGRFD